MPRIRRGSYFYLFCPPACKQGSKSISVVYFNQLLGAARTQKLVEICDFRHEITEKV